MTAKKAMTWKEFSVTNKTTMFYGFSQIAARMMMKMAVSFAREQEKIYSATVCINDHIEWTSLCFS